MKKSMISRLALMAVLIIIAGACSKKQAEYLNVIPADATTVVSVNLKSLAEKAGVNDAENEGAKQKLIDALKNGTNAATFQQMEMILKDPKKSGIDVLEPLYAFKSPSFPNFNIIAKVSNEGDLATLLGTLEKEKISQPVASGDGYQYTTVNNQVLMAYTPSVFMMVNYKGATQLEDTKQSISASLKQSGDASITSKDIFKKMQDMNGDINAFITPSGMLDAYTNNADINSGMPEGVNLKDMQIVGKLSFDKGKISVKYEYYTENPKAKAWIEEQMKVINPVENTFLKHFPKSTLVLGNFGINGEELYNSLMRNEEFKKLLSGSENEEVKALFGIFEKDVTVGLIDVTMNDNPKFLAYAGVKNAAPVQMLYEKKGELKLKNGQDIVKLGENEYVFKAGGGLNVFYGVRDNYLYATNDELLYKNIDKSADPSIVDTEYAKNMKGKYGSLVIDAENILALPVVKMLMEYGGTQYATAISLANKVSYIECVASDDNNVEFIMHLKDKDTNALKQIADFTKKFAGI